MIDVQTAANCSLFDADFFVLVRPTIFLRNLRVAYGRLLGAPADHVADGWFGRNVFTLNQGWHPIGLRYLLFWNMEGQRR